jgi:hypothetical protein
MNIQKLAGTILIGISLTTACLAVSPGPEIDAATGVNALALLSGALLIFRSKKR